MKLGIFMMIMRLAIYMNGASVQEAKELNLYAVVGRWTQYVQ